MDSDPLKSLRTGSPHPDDLMWQGIITAVRTIADVPTIREVGSGGGPFGTPHWKVSTAGDEVLVRIGRNR